ncbi:MULTISPECIES: SPOR domain-containing protein [Pseudomonas]|uniref:SPOR domain-containing protein n=1 Tax=Pseudomonas TaxID=286 RepID=UPI0007B33BF4|nr:MULTISPECIES: SPOR domain-containing protein [Pseudomonas]AZC62543.1 Septum-associated cell division protein DedD [Pseudomonas chlororaphis subsp. piscium]AZC68780.1 Septum-associated cell division protein DedD [Pseudomonas chlororaphis subsp. piscium]AZC81235.1 Septum-associated cell division protein DedD [Pseudomonas chlororaphis subsp. piscium]KZO51211.1 sporulation repeat-containing protein [Pseudomonas chlororaphis subsp. piscium]MBP5059704.1 SPOR domain-containing protein [Pseudomonas
MAMLDNVYKQRMVGALVLVALAVIFLPMLFSREDEQRHVNVEAPAVPQTPAVTQVQIEPVVVPEPQALPQEPVPTDEEVAKQVAPSMPIAPGAPVASAPAPVPAPAAPPVAASKPVAPPPAPAPKPAPAQPIAAAPTKPDATPSRVDANGLSVSWSVQLASLSSRESAENLQKTLRSQGYNAYIRSADGKNRVFVGPLIERAEADRLRDLLSRQQNLKGFVVRFQPERG